MAKKRHATGSAGYNPQAKKKMLMRRFRIAT